MQACLLLLAACSSRETVRARADAAPDLAGPPQAASPAPARPRVLRVQADYLPSQLNPLGWSDAWGERITMHTVFEPLVVTTDSGGVRPVLALRMDIRHGGRLYVFDLRRQVRFHDGRPLVSDDVKFTIERLLARNQPADLLRAGLADILEVRTPDHHTVELLLRKPSYLLPAVLTEVGILPSHIYGRNLARQGRPAPPAVGSGPFRVEERETQQKIVLSRHDGYWGRRPEIERIEFVAEPDPARAFAALRNGQVDLLPSLYPGYYPDQVSGERWKKRFQVHRIHPYVLRILFFNLRHPPLRERRVRLALCQLVDNQRLVRELRNDLGQVLSGPFWALSSWYDSTIHPLAFDRREAARLLDVAGWSESKGRAGRRRRGAPLRLRIMRAREASESVEAGHILKQELRAAGISAEVDVADFGFMMLQLQKGRFELVLLGLAPLPDSDLSPLLHSDGALNFGGYANPVVDSLLEGMRQAPSVEARTRLARQLHRALHEDPAFVVLYAPLEVMVASRRVLNIAGNGRWPRLAALGLSDTLP